MQKSEYERFFLSCLTFGTAILAFHLYYFCFESLRSAGLTFVPVDSVVASLYAGGVFRSYLYTKLAAMSMMAAGSVLRNSRAGERPEWGKVLAVGTSGLFLYLLPPMSWGWIYLATTVAGAILCIWALMLLQRRLSGQWRGNGDCDDTFPQCEEKLENEHSINIPMKYTWQGKKRSGWINVVAPFRATLVLGTPGSGKSFSVYGPFIEQMIAKGYTMFVYDYKFPSLTTKVYNELLFNPNGYKVKPKVYIINFNDPTRSHRCNPINARYITDGVDSTEIAEIIMENVNKGKNSNANSFFTESAKLYVDALIYFLSIYDPDRGTGMEGTRRGCFCTIPHLIELMGVSYKQVLEFLLDYRELKFKINNFKEALDDRAMEQLQGQIASARIPLGKFSGSPTLYWVLSGDDFSLDVSSPDEPKIVCVGNDPDRQSIYSTTLALFTSRIFRQINRKGNLPCGVLIDEMPTIYLKGIDHLIDTGRENLVATVIGAQDKSQLVRDYGREYADVILNTVANIFSGQVNGETAQNFAKRFGQEYREEISYSDGDSSSVSMSRRLQDILPSSKIETLSQGTFFGKVGDNIDQKIRRKFFCAEIQIDLEKQREKKKSSRPLPILKDFGTTDKSEIDEIIMRNYERIQEEVETLVKNEVLRVTAKKIREGNIGGEG